MEKRSILGLFLAGFSASLLGFFIAYLLPGSLGSFIGDFWVNFLGAGIGWGLFIPIFAIFNRNLRNQVIQEKLTDEIRTRGENRLNSQQFD